MVLIGPEKVHEDRVRRMARRQGLVLSRCRMRDPLGVGFGRYKISDESGRVVFGVDASGRHAATLDEIEGYLTRARP